MKYSEIVQLSESNGTESRSQLKASVIKRLQQLDRKRVEAIAKLAHAELRSQFVCADDLERFELQQLLDELR